MSLFKQILRELFGLFVDDGSLAVGTILWIGVCVATPWPAWAQP